MAREVNEYIKQCAQRGLVTPEDVCQSARDRIDQIDKALFEADKLRPEKAVMQNVLRSFGMDLTKQTKRIVSSFTEETTQDELDPKTLQLMIKICELIAEKNASAREIMSFCGITAERDVEVYAALKWLNRNGILLRMEDSKYTQGPEWVSRPKS